MKTQWTKWLAATLVLSTTLVPTAVLAADSNKTFGDLGAVSQSKQEAILEAARQGLLSGDPNGQFRPTDTLTRQELAALLTKAFRLHAVQGTSAYVDVTEKDWGMPYIEAVRQVGLMNGDGKKTFRPTDKVTREELATVFVRAVNGVGARGGEQVTVKDAGAVSSWADESVDTALRLGLIDTKEGKFDPKAPLQRQDIAGFLLEIFQDQERTAVISKVVGDVVTIDGKPYLIEGKLKEWIGDVNRDALTGAVLRYHSVNRNVDDLLELEIVQSGAVLDLGSKAFNGVLKIAAKGVTIKGASVGQLVLKEGAADVTLAPGLEVAKLELPENMKLSDVIANFEEIKGQIKDVTGGDTGGGDTGGGDTGGGDTGGDTGGGDTGGDTGGGDTGGDTGGGDTGGGDTGGGDTGGGDTGGGDTGGGDTGGGDTGGGDTGGGGTGGGDTGGGDTGGGDTGGGGTGGGDTGGGDTGGGDTGGGDTGGGDTGGGDTGGGDTGGGDTGGGDTGGGDTGGGDTGGGDTGGGDTGGGIPGGEEPVTPKGLFFSELVWGEVFDQGIELYNPTGEALDKNLIEIRRSDGGEPIVVTASDQVAVGSTFVIIDPNFNTEGDQTGWYAASEFNFNLEEPQAITLSLYYDGQLMDIAVIEPGKTLTRKSGTVIGTKTGHEAAQWDVLGENTHELGTYE